MNTFYGCFVAAILIHAFLLLTYEKPELPQLAAPVYFLSQILDDIADKLCVKHYYPPCRKGENLSFLPVAIIPQ